MGIGPEDGSEAIKKAVCCGGVKGVEFVMFGSLSCSGAQSAALFLAGMSALLPPQIWASKPVFPASPLWFTLGSCCPQGLGGITLVV